MSWITATFAPWHVDVMQVGLQPVCESEPRAWSSAIVFVWQVAQVVEAVVPSAWHAEHPGPFT